MITLIFGAGASIPFFNPPLTTNYLTEKISSKKEWDKIIKKYSQYKEETSIPIVSSDIIIDVIKRIKGCKNQANFEEITEVLDKISSWGLDKMPYNNMMNLTWNVLLQIFKPTHPNPIGVEWNAIPFLLREIIAENILQMQSQNKSSNYNELSSLQKAFLYYLCNSDDDISIMSLNYDSCLLESITGLDFEKGFVPRDVHYLQQLDIKRFMDAKRVIYFPHGILNFQFVDNDNVTFWHDVKIANEKRWNGLSKTSIGSTTTVLPGKFSYNYNTFISTGQTKDDGLNHLPYAVYYQRLACDICKSNVIFTIGYSFSDDHINRLLKSYLKLNSNNKIIIVDYYTDEITTTYEYTDQRNILTKIHNVLGYDWGIMYNSKSGKKEPLNPAEIQCINSTGFGQMFNQVYFFKKGYEAFLNQYSEILEQIF